jgi:hypothetical protein
MPDSGYFNVLRLSSRSGTRDSRRTDVSRGRPCLVHCKKNELMHRSPHDFASLLRPVSPVEFFSSYWECRPLLIHRGDAEFYEALLTDRNLEDIISTSDLRYPAIRLAKEGSYYPPQAYTTDITLGRLTFNGVPDVKRVSE